MISNSSKKQKEKIIEDLIYKKNKIEDSLKSLNESVLSLQNGDDGNPYWNGENAYITISNLLSFIDNGYELIDCIGECEKSIKKNN